MTFKTVVHLDLETTGLDPARDEVLQIGIVDEAGTVLMNTLVRPVHRTSWPDAEKIHGIAPADVADAPQLLDVLSSLVEIVRARRVVIYNANFDSAFIPIVHEVAAEVHCCMLQFAVHYGEWCDYYGDYKWQQLATAAHYVLHELHHAHDAIADARACRSVYRYLNDPAEQARVDALREQRRVEDAVQRDQERIECLVRMELQSEDRRQRAERTRFEMAAGANLMHRLSMPMYQPAREPAPRTQQEKAERTEEYARLFFGVPLAVIRQEERTCNALPAYTKRTLVPPHLKALSYFKSQPPWLRKRLQPDAYLLTPKRFSWLYDTVQIEAIRAQHPLRRDYWPQQGYRLVTKSQLRKMGLKDGNIMVMLPVIEVETKYQGWIYMYEVPDP